jgi:hypothetical protein
LNSNPKQEVPEMATKRSVRKDSDTPRSFDRLLNLFPRRPGYRKRQGAFVELCMAYLIWYRYDTGPVEDRPVNAAARRSALHNQIMEIVVRLFRQPNAVKKFGGPIPNRAQVRNMIIHYLKK